MILFGKWITSTGLSECEKDDIEQDHILFCREWLTRFSDHSKRCGEYYSYNLKHRVENWTRQYVSNGAFIYAAHLLDYNMFT